VIPVYEPLLLGNELKYVTNCIKTNWISSAGDYIEKFENNFSRFCNTKYGIGCSNGTAAIHLALASLGIGKGNEVIIPTFTMIATCNAVIYTGAKPVLVDSEKETWNIDTAKIKEKITKNTKAIMPVHTYGHPVDIKPIKELAKEYNIYIIEDAAEAHGAEYKGKKIGSLGDATAFSFYANKIITTGEGGMVVTNNEEIAEKAKLLRNHAFTKPRFLHHELGFNYRMTNIQGAIGLAQMEKADELVNIRIKNAIFYNSLLKDVKGITLPPKKDWAKNVYWMYSILIEDDFGMTMQEVREELLKKGIDTRTFFIPIHKQPVFINGNNGNYPDTNGNYPISEELARKGLYLPSSSSLTQEQIIYISKTLASLKK
tara:strand:- start:9 stop:1124 length:1116 start_codon:yes stop_codon:yes gene_type:complete